MDSNYIINRIFNINTNTFKEVVEEVYQFQFNNNEVFSKWSNLVEGSSSKIPFLPISFFKTHQITTTNFEAEQIFESSGTTKTNNSKHFVKEIDIYKTSFRKCFELNFGNIKEYCILGLLPSYLERNNSSLVLMVDDLIQFSNHQNSGFYLNNYDDLYDALLKLENKHQKTLLIGVTYALLDFAEQFPLTLKNTIVMETGGMKGRKKEITSEEVHEYLKQQFNIENVCSEYGMTELLSQAYSIENNRYYCPPWMKVFVRNEEDPLDVQEKGRGVINIIDLANIYSCSFIATDDVGEVFEDGSFTIYGRLDNSDLRGCSLMLNQMI